jgi:phage FluMu protein gp41
VRALSQQLAERLVSYSNRRKSLYAEMVALSIQLLRQQKDSCNNTESPTNTALNKLKSAQELEH